MESSVTSNFNWFEDLMKWLLINNSIFYFQVFDFESRKIVKSLPHSTVLFEGAICIFVTGLRDEFVLLLHPEKTIITTNNEKVRSFIIFHFLYFLCKNCKKRVYDGIKKDKTLKSLLKIISKHWKL